MKTHVGGKEIITAQPARLESGLHKGKELSTVLEALLEDDSTAWLCTHPAATDCAYFSTNGSQSVMAHQSAHFPRKDPAPAMVGTVTGKTVTVEEAAERLQVSTSFVYKRLTDGSLAGERRGNAWRVPLRAIAEYRKKNGHQPAPASANGHQPIPEQRSKPKAAKARTFVEVGVLHDGSVLVQDTNEKSMWKVVPL